jgi:catechol 2,3-dioxygenase-like lactoylglutathione lyase family enzyme
VSPATVRYIVHDVDQALDFYCGLLRFEELAHPAPGFAMLGRDDLRLALNAVGGPGGASQPMPDGRVPEPGGWNRIQLEVADIEGLVAQLREAGASFRNDIVVGLGGKQILVEDPSGNVVELFEPHR